jgi:hypothetical protein
MWLEVLCPNPENPGVNRRCKILPQCYTFCWEWDEDWQNEYSLIPCAEQNHQRPTSTQVPMCGCTYEAVCGEAKPEIDEDFGPEGDNFRFKVHFKWLEKCGPTVGGAGSAGAGLSTPVGGVQVSGSAHGQAGLNTRELESWVTFTSDFSKRDSDKPGEGWTATSGNAGGPEPFPWGTPEQQRTNPQRNPICS